jgi:glycosyltransferase involved in cell wall biosynthesis
VRIGIAAGLGSGERGGVEAYARDLLAALDRHDPGNEHRALPAAERGALARARRALVALAGWAPGRDRQAERIDALGLDVVHYPATDLPELALRTPAVLTFFDMQEEFLPAFFGWRARRARRAAHRAAVRKAAQVIVPSRFTGECLRERYGTPEARIQHVPVGVSEAFAAAADEGEADRVRRRHGLGAQDFALYPANPWPHKNHERLFAAQRALAGQGLRIPVVCTGRLRGEARSAASLAAAAGVPADLVFDLGYVDADDLPALYRAARAVVFPSLFEGFGMPVLEALACGVPVACADLPPLVEVGAGAVRTFDPGDTGDVARAMREVWEDDALRARLRTGGLARAEEYRWARLVPALVRVYERAARGVTA